MAEITIDLVRELIDSQFPQWSALPLRPVEKGGHDNRTFRLGDDMAVRLPGHKRYAAAVEKEMTWLPMLAEKISLPITRPLAKGMPVKAYPFPWSVNAWLEGSTVTRENIASLNEFAEDLASFLGELQAIDARGGIHAGEHNFYRGGNLLVYDAETKAAIDSLAGVYDKALLSQIWALALSSAWERPPRWIHGDIAVGNLLVKGGRLCGVIDFGAMGTGDPACDLAIAWDFLDNKSRGLFFSRLDADAALIGRARGWSLWKALITYAGNDASSELAVWAKCSIDAITEEYHQVR